MPDLLRPASLRQLILSSFACALVPLGVLLWQGHAALDSLSTRAQRGAQSAAANARRVENMQGLVVNIERAVRQHQVVGDATTSDVALGHLRDYRQALETTCTPDNATLDALCNAQQASLTQLRDAFGTATGEEQLAPVLTELKQQQRRLTQHSWQRLDHSLEEEQARVRERQADLARQTVILVLLTLIIVAWASRRIARPVQRLERMIGAIGQHSRPPLAENIGGPRDLQRLGDRLHWLSSRLQQLEALRLALLRHASHELKTPLASIQEGCSLLNDGVTGPLTDEQREVTALLSASTDRLSQLTEQLLDYNQLLQQSAPQLETLDPRELIQTTLRQHALALQQRALAVNVQCRTDTLRTDARLFQRMLDNLLNNAQAYGEQGGRVCIRLEQQVGGTRLEVANSGPGIAPHLREQLFEPFERGQTPRQDSGQGSGLGLSVVADCARLLGGRAEIASEEELDVCVRILLPDTEAATR